MNPSEKSKSSKIPVPLRIKIAKKLLGKLASDLFLIPRGLEHWFYSAINYQFNWSKEGFSPFGNYYEFGVGGGGTLSAYFRALKKFCADMKVEPSKFQIFGFDTFEGLPESKFPEDKHPTWHKTKFSYDITEIKGKITSIGIDLNEFNIRFIKEDFKNSLTPSLRNEIKKFPPSIVTIDVDYYSSTKMALDWLEPILMSGTLFYFDDVWAFHGNPNYGELKAINEFNETFDGYLKPFPVLGLPGNAYIYSRKEFEY